MNCNTRNTRRGRLLALALMAAIGLALTGPGFAEEVSPRLVGTVNINTATPEQLELLPGIGEARAKAVVALRKERGGFKSIDELKEVKGIGEVGLERLRPFVRTEGKTTAELN